MERRGERFPSFPFLLVGFYWDWHGWLLYNNGMASSKRTDGRKTVCGLVAGNTRSRRLQFGVYGRHGRQHGGGPGITTPSIFFLSGPPPCRVLSNTHHADSFRVLFFSSQGVNCVARARSLPLLPCKTRGAHCVRGCVRSIFIVCAGQACGVAALCVEGVLAYSCVRRDARV